jgi:hypothetical protein
MPGWRSHAEWGKPVEGQAERGSINDPARVPPSGGPEVAEGGEQIRASHQQARCQPGLRPRRAGGHDQREAPDEPVEGAELQQDRHQPLNRRVDPGGCELPDRSDKM